MRSRDLAVPWECQARSSTTAFESPPSSTTTATTTTIPDSLHNTDPGPFAARLITGIANMNSADSKSEEGKKALEIARLLQQLSFHEKCSTHDPSTPPSEAEAKTAVCMFLDDRVSYIRDIRHHITVTSSSLGALHRSLVALLQRARRDEASINQDMRKYLRWKPTTTKGCDYALRADECRIEAAYINDFAEWVLRIDDWACKATRMLNTMEFNHLADVEKTLRNARDRISGLQDLDQVMKEVKQLGSVANKRHELPKLSQCPGLSKKKTFDFYKRASGGGLTEIVDEGERLFHIGVDIRDGYY